MLLVMATVSTQQQHRNLIGSRIADGRLQLTSLLGLGAYGVVYLARSTVMHPMTRSGRPLLSSVHAPAALVANGHAASSPNLSAPYFAVKCLNKQGLDQRQRAFQRREIFLHTMMSSHPNVVTLHRVIDHPWDQNVFVILDFCPDGDLFSMITEKRRYLLPPEPYVADPNFADGRPVPESSAYACARFEMDALIKSVFDQILDAVEQCHSLGIYHRDLKPENILCADGGTRVMLADFGLATGDRLSSDFGCGSSFYMSPECQGSITNRMSQYSTAANDVWSLGVILINLICGRNPWKQATPADETFREYLRDPDFLGKILPISNEVHAILKCVFALRPESRCSVRDLRRWIRAVPRLQASNWEMWQRHHYDTLALQPRSVDGPPCGSQDSTLMGTSPTLFDPDVPQFSTLSLRSPVVSSLVSPTALEPSKVKQAPVNATALRTPFSLPKEDTDPPALACQVPPIVSVSPQITSSPASPGVARGTTIPDTGAGPHVSSYRSTPKDFRITSRQPLLTLPKAEEPLSFAFEPDPEERSTPPSSVSQADKLMEQMSSVLSTTTTTATTTTTTTTATAATTTTTSTTDPTQRRRPPSPRFQFDQKEHARSNTRASSHLPHAPNQQAHAWRSSAGFPSSGLSSYICARQFTPEIQWRALAI